MIGRTVLSNVAVAGSTVWTTKSCSLSLDAINSRAVAKMVVDVTSKEGGGIVSARALYTRAFPSAFVGTWTDMLAQK